VEFDAKLVPYRFTASEVHISFQVIGELRMTRGLMDGAADARDARPSGAGSEEERLLGLQEQNAALPDPDGMASAEPRDRVEPPRLRISEPHSSLPACSAEASGTLQIAFDSGHPSFLVCSSSCSRELLPGQGKLLRWFRPQARPGVERWIVDSVNRATGDGTCPEPIENLELNLPPAPALRVTAKRAYVMVEELESLDDGTMSVPAVLCLVGVTISQRLDREANERLLSAIPEDALTVANSDSVSPWDSVSNVATEFAEPEGQLDPPTPEDGPAM